MAGYRESFGRKFHNTDSNYNLPSDDEEYSRLNLQHNALKLMTGTNCLAPLNDLPEGPKSILDLCCGSGQWVIEMAEEFPRADVIGLDICVPAIPGSFPGKYSFITGDVTKPLPFPAESFDLVQMRVAPSVSERIPILREIGRILRKDGFIVLAEPDECHSQAMQGGRSPAFVDMDHFITLLPHSNHSLNMTHDDEHNLPRRSGWSLAPILADMLNVSTDGQGNKVFSSIESQVFNLPIGVWSTDSHLKRIGALMSENQIGVLDGFRPALFEHNVLTEKQFVSLRQALMEEMKDEKLELLAPFFFAWAKKT